VVADGALASLLDVRVGAPLLRFERVIRVSGGRAVEYGVSFCPGERMTMVTALRRHPGTQGSG
jgi:DNA-binding GntR family transcriptional regulator